MFSVKEEEKRIEFEFSSQTHLVDRTIDTLRSFLGNEHGRTTALELVLRELLINAVEHGNLRDNSKTVSCRIEKIRENTFEVNVEDQGNGFDHSSLKFGETVSPDQERSRGYKIIHAHSDEIAFNEKGNSVTAWVTLQTETLFEAENIGDCICITPSYDITASSAEKFRETLVNIMDRNPQRVVIDFINVENIDSIALSILVSFARTCSTSSPPVLLEVRKASADILQLFEMTRLTELFMVTSEDDITRECGEI